MKAMIGEWTNRGRLIAELEALSNDELYSMFADNRLTRALDDDMCDDCKTRYGRCMSTSEDTPCPFTLSEWLDMTAQPGASILNRAGQREGVGT